MFFALVLFLAIFISVNGDSIDEEEEKLPTKCHVCKHLVQELEDELERSGKSNEIFRTGQIFQEQRKEISYRKSEVRLNEALENACAKVLDYKVHKDKIKALRYEKKESVTFNTLRGLRDRGVKVELGFPDEMWETPDAEVTRLKSRCELMVETYEDDLVEWYWNHQNENLTNWLCIERVLDPGEEDCFNETEPEKKDGEEEGSEKQEEEEEDKLVNEENSEENKRKETSKKEKKSKKKVPGEKTKHAKKADSEGKQESQNEEDDSEKIQRLIREQAKEQQEGRGSRKKPPFVSGRMDEHKRRELQLRLREIHDVDRLRRELRKIRTREMSEDDYLEREPWEHDIDSDIPEDVRRDMRRRRFERMDDPEDLKRELRRRVIDLDDIDDDDYFPGKNSFVFRELSHRYMMEAEEIRDPTELKKRIDDIDAFAAIFHGGRDHRHFRDRYRRHHRDEL